MLLVGNQCAERGGIIEMYDTIKRAKMLNLEELIEGK